MVGKSRKPLSDDDFVDPNTHLRRAPYFMDASGRKVLAVHQVFRDARHFNEVLLDYAIEKGFELKKIKNSRYRVTAKCRANDCPFRVHASPSPDGSMFVIKTLIEKHTCQVVKANKIASSRCIATRLTEDFKDCPNLDVGAMMSTLRKKYMVDVPVTKLYRVRCTVKGKSMETHSDEYVILRCYAKMALKTNPGSVVKIQSKMFPSDMPPLFERIFFMLPWECS